jgi:enamine deaminase RidA (YjgF/YER057c/UK114 family)
VTDLVRFQRVDGLAAVPYAHSATVSSTGLLFSAGACPLDDAGRVIGPGDLEQQTRVTLQNLAAVLAASQADLSNVVKSTVYVATNDRADLVAVWNVVKDAFAPHEPPSTLIGVSVLGYPDQLVEIEVVAVLPASDSG